MNTYLVPLQYAFLTFPIVAFMLTIPFLIVQYRTYGYVNKMRSFVLFSFLLYCISAYYLVILPLPQNLDNCVDLKRGAVFEQWVPFNFVNDFLKETRVDWSNPASYVHLLKERAFLQAFFNVALTIPLGIYMRYYFRRSFVQTVLVAFAVAIFFEVTQRTGLYGLYECPYRLLDVDDLILNTSGGIIGFIIAPIITYFLPRADEMDANVDLKAKTVGFIRRGIALGIDYLVLIFCVGIANIILHLGWSSTFDYSFSLESNAIFLALFVLIYFMIVPTFTNGKTFGKWMTRIQVQKDDVAEGQKRITFIALFKRYGLLYFGIYGVNYAIGLALNADLHTTIDGIVMMLLGLAWFVFNGIWVVHLLLHLFKKDKRLFYEKMSRTRNVITIPNRMRPYQPDGEPHLEMNDGQVIDVNQRKADVQDQVRQHEMSMFNTSSIDVRDVSSEGHAKQPELPIEDVQEERQAIPNQERLVEQEMERLRARIAQSSESTQRPQSSRERQQNRNEHGD
ncbi:VanZ family protein [Paenibacillus sp. 481]|uniref:VanZ family protein n=1 Tax=Paenibacillus sp. 481 TaxID=2835869 RepID=UPI001E60EC70|nr:VanZ family protein [Paenibacillus sp. 481]UHA72893.1 VanZ family protein [Paenibacillus sp. 481]